MRDQQAKSVQDRLTDATHEKPRPFPNWLRQRVEAIIWTLENQVKSPAGQAAAGVGGPWLCRVRSPVGLVAVTVPSGCKVMPQPHRCTAIKWWKEHKSKRLVRQVGPPWARGMTWCGWQAATG